MVEEHYYSTTPGASSEQLPFTAGSQAARLLSRQPAAHGSDFLQVFYGKKDVLCALIISDVKGHFNGNHQRVGAIAL